MMLACRLLGCTFVRMKTENVDLFLLSHLVERNLTCCDFSDSLYSATIISAPILFYASPGNIQSQDSLLKQEVKVLSYINNFLCT